MYIHHETSLLLVRREACKLVSDRCRVWLLSTHLHILKQPWPGLLRQTSRKHIPRISLMSVQSDHWVVNHGSTSNCLKGSLCLCLQNMPFSRLPFRCTLPTTIVQGSKRVSTSSEPQEWPIIIFFLNLVSSNHTPNLQPWWEIYVRWTLWMSLCIDTTTKTIWVLCFLTVVFGRRKYAVSCSADCRGLWDCIMV